MKALDQARGQALREAIDSYKQAHACDPKWVRARNPLRVPPEDDARLKEAVDHYRQAIRLDPQFAPAHGALGQALLARREFAEADAAIRRGLDLVPEGVFRANLKRLLQRCQRLRALESRLSAVVQGKDRPAAVDCLDLAELCFVKSHYATAARLYAAALAATAQWTEDLRGGHRCNAARAAALAGSGRGDDGAGLGEPERAGLRKQARQWLRLDLAALARKVDGGTAADRILAQKMLAPWRDDADLAGMRDAGALEKLPPGEQQECRALWQEVTTLLRRAESTP